MPGGKLPTAERIAAALALAAWRLAEVDVWAVHPADVVLDCGVPLRSRWVALCGLLALNPGLTPGEVGPFVGARDAAHGLRLAMLAPWWDRKHVELLVVDVILHEDRRPPHHPVALVLARITDAVRARADHLQKEQHA